MPAKPASLPVFDPAQLLALSPDDAAFTRTLATRLIQTNHDDVRALLAAHASGNPAAVAARAHRIRGGCMIVGAQRVAQQATELEAHIQAHGLGTDCARSVLRLARRVRELERALLAWLPGAGG